MNVRYEGLLKSTAQEKGDVLAYLIITRK